jgi:hypothetical protein
MSKSKPGIRGGRMTSFLPKSLVPHLIKDYWCSGHYFTSHLEWMVRICVGRDPGIRIPNLRNAGGSTMEVEVDSIFIDKIKVRRNSGKVGYR